MNSPLDSVRKRVAAINQLLAAKYGHAVHGPTLSTEEVQSIARAIRVDPLWLPFVEAREQAIRSDVNYFSSEPSPEVVRVKTAHEAVMKRIQQLSPGVSMLDISAVFDVLLEKPE
jgi:hypothetical protein